MNKQYDLYCELILKLDPHFQGMKYAFLNTKANAVLTTLHLCDSQAVSDLSPLSVLIVTPFPVAQLLPQPTQLSTKYGTGHRHRSYLQSTEGAGHIQGTKKFIYLFIF